MALSKHADGARGAPFSVPFRFGTPKRELEKLYPRLFSFPVQRPDPEPADVLYTCGEGLPDDFLLRRQYVPKSSVTAANPVCAVNWAIYRNALKEHGYADVIVRQSLDEMFNSANWLDIAKWFGEKAKKERAAFDKDWLVLVDLSTFGGYATISDDDFFEQVRTWVTDVHKLTYNGSEEEFDLRFAAKCTWFAKTHVAYRPLTGDLDAFCSDPTNWGLAGSSFDVKGVRLFVEIEGKRYKAKKNKWASALALSPEQVKSRILDPHAQVAKAVVKRETKKARGVVSVDLDTYLKQAFISWAYLDPALRGNTLSTLWMTADQRAEFWDKYATIDGVKMPLDQSSFDNVVKRSMVAALNQALIDRGNELHSTDKAWTDVKKVFELTRDAMYGGYVIVGKRHLPYKNGVLSGWRWTALFDTIINIVENEMARDLCAQAYGPINYQGFCAQGDDDWVVCKTTADCVALWLAYDHMGFIVNPSKFFISGVNDEFLRRVLIKRPGKPLVTGYPARAVNSISNRNPINEPQRPGADRLNNTLTSWNTLVGRLGGTQVPQSALEDMARGSELPVEAVVMWLHTPIALGGGGVDVRPGIGLGSVTARRLMPSISPVHAPGIAAVVTQVHAAGMRVDKREMQRWLESVLKFDPKTYSRVGEWQNAEAHPVSWQPLRVFYTREWRVEKLPKPPQPWARFYAMFPSEDNARANPLRNNKPTGIPMWWWTEACAGLLAQPTYRKFGRSWESLAPRDRFWAERAQGEFVALRHTDPGMWRLVLATVELAMAQNEPSFAAEFRP